MGKSEFMELGLVQKHR